MWIYNKHISQGVNDDKYGERKSKIISGVIIQHDIWYSVWEYFMEINSNVSIWYKKHGQRTAYCNQGKEPLHMFKMDEYRTSRKKYIKESREGMNMLMDVQTLRELADVDICTVSKDSLVDIRDVKIDTSKSREERISDYIRQVKNPYCFQCNGIIVKMNFCQSEETLEDKLAGYFLSIQWQADTNGQKIQDGNKGMTVS